MNFDLLVQSISDVHRQFQAQAVKAVNMGLTLRNWLIAAYISEYELRGEDRAKYGEGFYPKLSKRLKQIGLSGVNARELPVPPSNDFDERRAPLGFTVCMISVVSNSAIHSCFSPVSSTISTFLSINLALF